MKRHQGRLLLGEAPDLCFGSLLNLSAHVTTFSRVTSQRLHLNRYISEILQSSFSKLLIRSLRSPARLNDVFTAFWQQVVPYS